MLGEDVSAQIDAALAWAAQPGNCLLTLADATYPRELLQTEDPPTLLYVKGRIELLNRPASRWSAAATARPRAPSTRKAFAALSQAGLTVVSGLALGIDGAAHRGALTAPGATVAVIGTGADRLYPARNRDLALRIAVEGVIVSEFHMGTPALAANFPRRNRVISGLSLGVLVVEAAERSGSLITARLAAEQGRDVFAIPGSIHSPLSKGCHQLIKQGAKLVDDAPDILEELDLQPRCLIPRREQPQQEDDCSVPWASTPWISMHWQNAVDCPLSRSPQHCWSWKAVSRRLPGGRFQRLN